MPHVEVEEEQTHVAILQELGKRYIIGRELWYITGGEPMLMMKPISF